MLMMAKMGALLVRTVGGVAFPEVTLTAANFGDGMYGYIKSGGAMAEINEVSGGSLSSTPLPGFTMDAIADDGGALYFWVTGDAETALTAVTNLKINGSNYAVTVSPSYNSGLGVTQMRFTSGGIRSAGAKTVQLV